MYGQFVIFSFFLFPFFILIFFFTFYKGVSDLVFVGVIRILLLIIFSIGLQTRKIWLIALICVSCSLIILAEFIWSLASLIDWSKLTPENIEKIIYVGMSLLITAVHFIAFFVSLKIQIKREQGPEEEENPRNSIQEQNESRYSSKIPQFFSGKRGASNSTQEEIQQPLLLNENTIESLNK